MMNWCILLITVITLFPKGKCEDFQQDRQSNILPVNTTSYSHWFVKDDTMMHPVYWLLLSGILYETANGITHGLDHCIKRKHGKCTECKYGWYGNHCNKKCHHRCWHRECERKTGICIQCKPGYYTNFCHTPCPQKCEVSVYDNHRHCHQTTGNCLEGCNASYWGLRCTKTCNKNCEESVCEEIGGICLLGCTRGWFGETCNETCQDHCLLGGCGQKTGKCIQCSPGYYTETCNKPCPFNCEVSYDNQRHCNRTTGYCLEGCTLSFWGSQCDKTCSFNCKGSACQQTDGTCLAGCNNGWFGETCNKDCPEYCRAKQCSIKRGECSQGCINGFHGRMCNISCSNCIDEVCSINEVLLSVTCTIGCKDGWTSQDCQCSSKCQGGKCERSGRCVVCPDGYYGDTCDNICPEHCTNCDRGEDCTEIATDNSANTANGEKPSEVNVSAKATSSMMYLLLYMSLWLTWRLEIH